MSPDELLGVATLQLDSALRLGGRVAPIVTLMRASGAPVALALTGNHDLDDSLHTLQAGVLPFKADEVGVAMMRPVVAELDVTGVLYLTTASAYSPDGRSRRTVMSWARHLESGVEFVRGHTLDSSGRAQSKIDGDVTIEGLDWIRELVR